MAVMSRAILLPWDLLGLMLKICRQGGMRYLFH